MGPDEWEPVEEVLRDVAAHDLGDEIDPMAVSSSREEVAWMTNTVTAPVQRVITSSTVGVFLQLRSVLRFLQKPVSRVSSVDGKTGAEPKWNAKRDQHHRPSSIRRPLRFIHSPGSRAFLRAHNPERASDRGSIISSIGLSAGAPRQRSGASMILLASLPRSWRPTPGRLVGALTVLMPTRRAVGRFRRSASRNKALALFFLVESFDHEFLEKALMALVQASRQSLEAPDCLLIKPDRHRSRPRASGRQDAF